MTRPVSADASFAKYQERGAYHWREIGAHLIGHNAFTAERYRMVADRADLAHGERVLDYGCGDGALMSVLARHPSGRSLTFHGYDPNALAIEYAGAALQARGITATL